MPDRPTPPPVQTRLADRALVLTLATFLLLTPPMIAVFDVAVPVFGVPLLHIYAFAVWAGAIVVGGIIAHRLMRGSGAGAPPDGAS
jgi:cytochrome bd-type quinol oxidase subunit 1